MTHEDATALAALVATGQASPTELVTAAIGRIEELDGRLNAVVHRRFEQALEEAAGPLPDGPFRGVPIVLKDLRSGSAGDPDYQGNAFLRDVDHRAAHDAHVTAGLRRAGFVILGRTNTPEFGLVSTTEPKAFGPTRNPWDLTRSPGGSSGGSAVAVATGMVPLAQGTDGGGSLRMPSAHCGVFGFKSSRGRVSAGPDEGDALAAHNVYGVITRSVRDSAAVLDAIAGEHSGDPVVAPRPATTFLDAVTAAPGSLRIGVMLVDDVNGYPVDPRVNAVVRRMADRLTALGHRVEEAYPAAMTDPAYLEHWLGLLSPSVTVLMDDLAAQAGRPLRRDEFEEVTWWWADQGAKVSAADYVRHETWRDDFRRRMAAWWTGGFDLLLSPVVPNPPPELGVFDGPDGIRKSIDILCFTPQFNTTGQPAMAVPASLPSEGLPIGVQFAAAYGREELLFSLAGQLEAAHPWTGA
ncbi:amidase [Actinoplanes sp. TRM 88003]|uniref:Amidase n=1 Tax=Paractinoplanes aksuensis TaxID=2939490 RepID=A0ABT1E2Z9_9ACTN|nr:amidase [Actinoplanes aksuensis]MCO8277520.1 amidase [Actinoplanes aksuensis]